MAKGINLGYAGKRVVVTGVSSGMGRSAAEWLVEEGAVVTGLDIQDCDLQLARFERLDLKDVESIRSVAAALEGEVDVLLNCAGVGNLPDPRVVHWINYLGTRRLTEEIIPKMRRGAAIANIASKSGLDYPKWIREIVTLVDIEDDAEADQWLADFEPAQQNPYGFSKACATVYTLARAAQLAGQGIRMNCTSPGASDTGFFGEADANQIPAVVKSYDHFGRLATPQEQALPLLYLASDAASYVSGANLVVDAGGLGGYLTGKLEPPPVPTYANILDGWTIGY